MYSTDEIADNFFSQVLGWASLIAAAGVSYYFAKKGINERRAEQDAAGTRPTEKLDCKHVSYERVICVFIQALPNGTIGRQKIERDSQTQAQAASGTSPGKTDQAQALQISVSTDEKHGKVG